MEDISKGNANFSELPHTLNIYGGIIGASFVLSSKGTPACNSSSIVLVPNRTSPSLLHTFVVDTLLNFPLPFNILTPTHPAFTPSGVLLIKKLRLAMKNMPDTFSIDFASEQISPVRKIPKILRVFAQDVPYGSIMKAYVL